MRRTAKERWATVRASVRECRWSRRWALLRVIREADDANTQTMILLLRGMPLPTSFGFPGTDGTLLSNMHAFVCNNHPLVSVFAAHAMHPFTHFERGFVYACSVIFSFVINQHVYTDVASFNESTRLGARLCAAWQAAASHASLASPCPDFSMGWLLVKWALVILYAVLIRQLAICPCFALAMLEQRRALFGDDGEDASRRSARAARRYDRIKRNGERGLLALSAVHVALLVHFVAVSYTLDRTSNRAILENTLVQELGAVAHWFVRFVPLFCVLHPAHRHQWYRGGSFRDALKRTLLCRAFGPVAGTERHLRGEHCVRPLLSTPGACVWRQHGYETDTRRIAGEVVVALESAWLAWRKDQPPTDKGE